MSDQLDGDFGIENNMNMYDERVGFGRRLGAYLLDLLGIIILGSIINVVAGEFLVQLFFGAQLAEAEIAAAQFEGMGFDYMALMTQVTKMSAGTSIATLLLFVMEGIKGQSIGKMILQIENTNANGTEAEPKVLWTRTSLKYGSTLLSLLGGLVGLSFIGSIGSIWGFVIFIGFFFALAEKKQTIHDMIAKTVVSWK